MNAPQNLEQPLNLRPSLIRVTVLLLVTKGIGFALAFFREVVIAANFGVSKVVDAFASALIIPLSLFSLFSNVIIITLIPHYIYVQSKFGTHSARRSTQTLITHSIVAVLFISSVLWVFARNWIGFIATNVPLETELLIVQYFKISIVGVVFGVIYLYLQTLHQIQEKWWRQALAPILGNTIGLLVLGLGVQWFGAAVLPYSWVVAVGVMSLMFLFSRLGREYLRPVWSDPYVSMFYFMALPVAIESVYTGTLQVYYRALALNVGEGELAAFSYAMRLYSMLCDLFVASFFPAMTPRLVTAANESNRDHFFQFVRRSLLIVTWVTLLVVAVLGGLSRPLIEVLFERGAFTHQDTIKVASIFWIMLGTLLCFNPLMVLYRTYQSIRKMYVPTISMLTSSIFLYGLPLLLLKPYRSQGLAIAMLVGLLYQGIFLILMGKRFQIHFPKIELFWLFVGGSVVVGVVSMVLRYGYQWSKQWVPIELFGVKVLWLGLWMVVGVALFGGLALLLRLPITDEIRDWVNEKVQRFGLRKS